jgi:hypothetical protein
MGVLSQALEIIFEVQMNNEKIARRKISFSTYETHFFFPLFEPVLFSKLLVSCSF